MPWWSDYMKKHSCLYLLHRYLGKFLEEKLTVDQLSVDLYNGIGTASNVTLDVDALNELGKQHNLPVEFVDGFISEISVSVPWSSLLNDSSSVEVHGMHLVIQPKFRSENCSSMFDSMWSSMTSSIQLAEECLKQSNEHNLDCDQSNFVIGVEDFAKAIDSILTRVKLNFTNTVIRIEHLSKESSAGVAVEIHIKQFNYYDENSTEIVEENLTKPVSAYSVKVFSFEGVELYSHEFYSSNRTMSKSLLTLSASSLNNEHCISSNQSKDCDDEIILLGKLLGKQEVRLKIKQKENIPGIKIDLEVNLNSCTLFLSPRQLRTTCDVIYGLMSPHLQDTSNVSSRSRYNQKPMTTSDFERVEHELIQHMNPLNFTNFVSKSLQNATGWSSGGVEDESDDDFHPIKGNSGSSLFSSASNSVSSSYSSVSSYHYCGKVQETCATHHHKTKDKGGTSESSDFNGDSSSLILTLNFFAIILLHEDILLAPDNSTLPTVSMIKNLKRLSANFFNKFHTLSISCGRNDFSTIKQILQQTINDRNHFRLLCTTNVLNSEKKSNHLNCEIRGLLSLANVELTECLAELTDKTLVNVELLKFLHHNTSTANDVPIKQNPDFQFSFKQFKSPKHYSSPSRTELNFKLEDYLSEVDVTIIDRLTHLIENFNLFYEVFVKPSANVGTVFSDVVNTSVNTSKLDWKVVCPFTRIKLRFPVPDLNIVNENLQDYWHKRDIYDDILFIELTENSFKNLVSDNQLSQNLEIRCKSVQVLFQESNKDKLVPFIFSGIDDKFGLFLSNDEQGFGWPRLVLRLCPKFEFIELEDIEEKQDYNSYMSQSIIQSREQEPSPFAAKMIMRESDTSHSKSAPNNDGEELIQPGSEEEIRDFIEDASHNALVHIDVMLPTLIFLIPSKHFYEVIYNRFSSDFMLWKPKIFEQFRYNKSSKSNFNFEPSATMYTKFSMCKSNMKTNSDSEDEENDENIVIVNENQKKKSNQQQSLVTISLSSSQGVIDIFPHARDSQGKVIPGQFGEIQIMFNDGSLFYVSGYKSDHLLSYICLQVKNVSLHHSSLIPSNVEIRLRSFDSYSGDYLLPTIYKTDKGAVINENICATDIDGIASGDMLTLSVRMQGGENRIKNICVANSLNRVTIRHRMKSAYTSWLSQLIDVFDIMEYPITNYTPWKIVTQLHQQFLNCVIDYRPLYLPLKAALTVENFNISSNITAKTTTSILRFIIEEASLFLSNKVNDKSDQPEDLSIDLKNDYVCVVDLGLFELSLRLTDNGENEPHTDLRASSNIVHISTCADSAVALMDLVKYIAFDGDLCKANQAEYPSGSDTLVSYMENERKENIPGTAVRQNEGVPHLVEEAINDTAFIKPNKRRGTNTRNVADDNIQMFYFPNEDNISINISSIIDSQSSEDEFETEFCILEQEIGIGYLGKSNVPEVRLLTKEPIRVIDNHFTIPIQKVDVLKAPKGYPNPVSKYTLREITVVWHMYGGHDFEKNSQRDATSSEKKQVNFPDNSPPSQNYFSHDSESRRFSRNSSYDNINISYSVRNSMSDSSGINFMISRSSPVRGFSNRRNSLSYDSPGSVFDNEKNNNWQIRGGVNRKNDVLMELRLNKLKFQYELYPTNTKHASRQVLVVQEVEIRDRMASSNINKFLYLHSSSARPKQSHANMVVIKATRIRPEPNISNLQECCLRVSLLPLRLNIDQDSLVFLINYFTEISALTKSSDSPSHLSNSSKPSPPYVMKIENSGNPQSSKFMVQIDGKPVIAESISDNMPVFIKSFIFAPEVPIRVDYEGKRVDMSHGPLTGLIMGLGQLNSSELKLKRLCNRQGFLGIDKLISYILTEWLQDIKKNQLPSILGGVGPMYSLVQLFQGIRDLFWLPIEQYQRDGRIVRGLQRGANSFTTSTAMAALELTARIVHAIQKIAETAYDIVSPGPSIRHIRYYDVKNDRRKTRRQHKYNQPADIREGVTTALLLVKEGLGETAQALVRVASLEHEVKGAVGAVGGVLRQIPSTALTPIIIASQATSNVIDGVRSQLVPDARAEAALKWRTDYF